MPTLDKLVSSLARAIKAEDAAADRYQASNMSATLYEAWEKKKAAREKIERSIVTAKKRVEGERDAFDASLRDQGRDEMRRRWRAGEKALNGPGRPHFILEVERYAADAKGDRQRWLRENLGEREAEFRLGIATEAAYLLRNLSYGGTPKKPTAAELREGEKRAHEWVMSRR